MTPFKRYSYEKGCHLIVSYFSLHFRRLPKDSRRDFVSKGGRCIIERRSTPICFINRFKLVSGLFSVSTSRRKKTFEPREFIVAGENVTALGHIEGYARDTKQ
jgi:hypothetical protein